MTDAGLLVKLRTRLSRGDSWLTYDLGRLFSKDTLADEALEELETRLLTADAGVEATRFLIEQLGAEARAGRVRNEAALRAALREALLEWLRPVSQRLSIPPFIRPYVLLAVGVNGVGKTTTIGKLAARFHGQGHSVLLAAGDTFRAAAVDQLKIWAERTGSPVVAQSEGAQKKHDSASVIYDAVQTAKNRGIDVVIADSAGRLHTKDHLMEELRKIKRAIAKHDAFAPHEVLLVIDATTGGNALTQAVQFHEAIGLTGLALTKLDGTARGGIVLAIARRLSVPIRYIGVGEGVDDLEEFDAEAFVDALMS